MNKYLDILIKKEEIILHILHLSCKKCLKNIKSHNSSLKRKWSSLKGRVR